MTDFNGIRNEAEISNAIIGRFFTAIEKLKESGAIRGEKTFTDRCGINRRNLWAMRRNLLGGSCNPGKLQPSWLYRLVNDYNVSASWLLTGKGDIFRAKNRE